MKLLFVAFPEEFVGIEEDAFCQENKTEILKTFTSEDPIEIPMNPVAQQFDASRECKVYCALEKRCWGCIRTCKQQCQWDAVTNCERQKRTSEYAKQLSLQKAGRINPNRFCTKIVDQSNTLYVLFILL